jgi:hypothetical protein
MTRLIPVAALALAAYAQAPSEPPDVIRLHRSPSTPGAAGRLIRPYIDGRAPVTALAMAAVSGPSEVWLLETLDSFEVLENVDKALSAFDPPEAGISFICVYRQALSYRPEDAIKLLPRARYVQASVFRIRPGSEAEFAELMRMRRAGFDTINLDRPDIAYQVVSGIQAPAFVFLTPFTNLKGLDEAIAKWPVYAERAGEAAVKARRQIATEAEVSRETMLLRIDPRNSYVSEAFASGDPDFWGVKAPNQ